jgi:hypothetical protein
MQIIKRIGACVLGTVMTGASLLAPALAADLSDYPAPFITDGTTNFLIVVGANAATSDVVGAINTAVRLGAEPGETKTCTAGVAGSSVSEGASLSTSSTALYLGSAVNSVTQTLTSSDLSILEDQTFTDDGGIDYKYSQYIKIGPNQITFAQQDTNSDPVVAIQMDSSTVANSLYNVSISFNKALAFNASDSEGQEIVLMGKTYTISSDTDSDTIVLYGSAVEETIEAGQEKTVTINGNEYTIKVLGVTSGTTDVVTVSVNGDTKDINEGQSKKVGGVSIYAKRVSAYTAPENSGSATLQIGSQKLTFENATEVMTGDSNDAIDGTYVLFTGTVGALSGLTIAVYAPDSDNDYVAADKEFVDPVFGNFKVLLGSVNPDLTDSSKEQIKITTAGDDTAKVTFTDSKGNNQAIEFAHHDGSALYLADDNNRTIHVVEGEQVNKNEYVLFGKEDYGHIVQVTNIRNSTGQTNDYVTLKDVMSSDTYRVEQWSAEGTGSIVIDGKTYTITMVDATTPYITINDPQSSGNSKVVYPTIRTLNGADLALVANATLNVSAMNGASIILPTGTVTLTLVNGSVPTWNLTSGGTTVDIDLSTGASDSQTLKVGNTTYKFYETSTANTTIINVNGVVNPAILLKEEVDANVEYHTVVVDTEGAGSSTNGVGVNDVTMTSASYNNIATSDDDITEDLDFYGTFVVVDATDSDQKTATIYYPDNQMTIHVFVAPTSATVSAGAAGTTTYEEVVPIKDNIARLDTDAEVESAKSNKNLILIGGPCANKLVASLAADGKTLSCGDWLDGTHVGEARIQLIEDAFTTGKVALIAAGLNAENTRAACRVLQQYDEYALTGKLMKVTGTTSPTVTAITETTTPTGNTTEGNTTA